MRLSSGGRPRCQDAKPRLGGDWPKVSFTERRRARSSWKTGPRGRYVDLPFAKRARTTPLTARQSTTPSLRTGRVGVGPQGDDVSGVPLHGPRSRSRPTPRRASAIPLAGPNPARPRLSRRPMGSRFELVPLRGPRSRSRPSPGGPLRSHSQVQFLPVPRLSRRPTGSRFERGPAARSPVSLPALPRRASAIPLAGPNPARPSWAYAKTGALGSGHPFGW